MQKLPSSASEEKRRQAVLLRKKGLIRAEIGEIVREHADTVGRWLKAYRECGAQSLKLNQCGRREGCGRRLDEDQERKIQKLLVDKTPDQLKMPYAMWTRKSVQLLIKSRFSVDLPIRTVGHYLKRWGMIPQKPVKRPYEQQPAQVQKWLHEEYPEIHDKAVAENVEISWG